MRFPNAAPVPTEIKAPSPLLLMLEARAPWEYAALMLSGPWMRQLPRGDGHPVLVLPGLGVNDLSTWPLRRLLGTLGTPFAGPPKANHAWRLYELLSGHKIDAPHERSGPLHRAPPVPTTSIYSRSDGVVAWPCSLNEDAAHTENIEVVASHTGLGLNPLALTAVADRLAQDPVRWRKFDRPGALRWLMKHGPARPA